MAELSINIQLPAAQEHPVQQAPTPPDRRSPGEAMVYEITEEFSGNYPPDRQRFSALGDAVASNFIELENAV